MSPVKNEIQIEDDGFITTKKGLTLSSMALFIWLLTGILYKIISLFSTPDYVIFCFLISLSLSILCGLYITNRLIRKTNFVSKLILITANILLLYSSANGIQSGVCFVYGTEPDDKIQTSSFLSFFETKPWLPDKFQFTKIQNLNTEKKSLLTRIDRLESIPSDRSELLNQIQKYRTENDSLRSSLNKIKRNVESRNELQRDWNSRITLDQNHRQIENLIKRYYGNEFYQQYFKTQIKTE